jgi:hypothetical protein
MMAEAARRGLVDVRSEHSCRPRPEEIHMVLVMQQRASMLTRADVTGLVDVDQTAERRDRLNRHNDDAHAAYAATHRHEPAGEHSDAVRSGRSPGPVE